MPHNRKSQVVPVQVTLQTYEHPEQAPWRHRFHNIFGMLPPLSPPEGARNIQEAVALAVPRCGTSPR